jgi:acyl-CoA synthetase (NDP forming)
VKNAQQDTKTFWQYLFAPESVAVVGASNTPGTWGNTAIKGLLTAGGRRIYPINPKATEILGVKAYQSITDVPDSIDMAVIVVADRLVPGVLRECAAKSVKTAVIITSGFSEVGEQGRILEAELNEIAERGGIRFIGPNSMGHADTRSNLDTFGQSRNMPMGPVAVLAQSGSMSLKTKFDLADIGIDCSKYVSTGNEANIYLEDYLEYLAQDDDTKLIVAYIEGLRDGRRFLKLAKEITKHKPIVAIKAGGTEASARAVMSHTGSLAGSDAVYDAAFRQSGVIRVDDGEEICDLVHALINWPLPRSNRVGILSIGGGIGALATEACEKEGLIIGKLAPSTIKRLDQFLPSRWPRRNPVDMAGPSTSDIPAIVNLLSILIEDPNIDSVFLIGPLVMNRQLLVNRMGLDAEGIKTFREQERKNLQLIQDKAKESGKPVVFMWQTRTGFDDQEVLSTLKSEKIMPQSRPRGAARLIARLSWYRRYLDATAGRSARILLAD